MKRRYLCVFLLICVLLLAGNVAQGEETVSIGIGDHVFFGHYEQDNDPENGAEAIEWRVLDQGDDGSLLLITEYGLDAKPFITPLNKVIWENSTLRKWLNKEFLSTAFLNEEKNEIMKKQVDNSSAQGNEDFAKMNQKNTNDQVFILSYAEADAYFSDNDDRECAPTAYAVAQGAFVKDSNGKCVWWLRSPGSYLNWATRVNHFGVLGTERADQATNCVRPVIWVKNAGVLSVQPN